MSKSITDNYFRKCQYLLNANSNLKKEIIALKFENADLKEENERLKSKGLKVLEFYEYKSKNADRKEFENAREELWIVKEVLYEMGVIKDE